MAPFSDADLFDDEMPTKWPTPKVAGWPLWALVTLSAAGIVVALFNQTVFSLVAYGVLVAASFVLLFYYRMSSVAATRAVDANASLVGVKGKEKLAILACVVSCLANGIVLGLELGNWEVWFK